MPRKWITDVVMTLLLLLLLLLLMGYSLVGEVIHEWLGIAMLALLIIRHIMNLAWYRSLGKGHFSAYRCVQTSLNWLLLLAAAGATLSGIVLSRYALDFLPLHGGEELAQTIHLPCAYWSLILASLHLGLHWSAVMGAVRRITCLRTASRGRTVSLRLLAAAVALYGLFVFFNNNFPDYLLLRTHFVFFSPDQTVPRLLVDNLAVMGLFVCLAHYAGIWLRRRSGRNTSQREARA